MMLTVTIFMQVQRRAAEVHPLAVVPVDMGSDAPKLNLTLLEGASLSDTVRIC